MYRELLLGCGRKRTKDLRLPTAEEIRRKYNYLLDRSQSPPRYGTSFEQVTTLDINSDHAPDVLCDLRHLPLAPWKADRYGEMQAFEFLDDDFDELHAYEVLEHIGQQGDAVTFFGQFSEFWRILKPGGLFFATCPAWHSQWAWGDPSHTRVITAGTLSFLSQEEYKAQVGVTPMSDFRDIYKADFQPLYVCEDGETFLFVLQAIKPSRWVPPGTIRREA